MSSGGFGFSFSGPNDDDENGRSGGGPFGGGLGDILNQFGQMLSGMGSSMNSPDGAGPVNYGSAKRIAQQRISSRAVTPQEKTAVAEAVRLADLWISDTTVLPAAEGEATAWSAEEWFSATLPMWQRLVDPVAQSIADAQLNDLPDEARQMMGGAGAMMKQMASASFGMQLGVALGDLANQTLSGADLGLPVAPAGVVALLPQHVTEAAKDLPLEGRDLLLYVAAREAARQRLFQRVPWLTERIVSSVEEFANDLVIDTSHIEEAARGLNLESGDPQAIQDAISELQGMDFSPQIRTENTAAVARLETILALVEGWVDHVVHTALGKYLSTLPSLSEAWRRRTATGGSAEQVFSQVVGIQVNAPKVRQAAELWRRSDDAVGMVRRDAVWDHPDFLPTAEDLDNPAEFIDGLLAGSEGEDFDPISEIEKLEEELQRGHEQAPEESAGGERPDDASPGDGDGEEPRRGDRES